MSTVPQDAAQARRPLQYVGAGVLYLLISGVLFLLWLAVDWYVVLLLSLPTCVAGLVLLGVGWPRWQRERAQERTADHRQAIAHPPTRVRRS